MPRGECLVCLKQVSSVSAAGQAWCVQFVLVMDLARDRARSPRDSGHFDELDEYCQASLEGEILKGMARQLSQALSMLT